MEDYLNKKITYISYFYNELYLKDLKYFIENINENVNFIIYTSYDIISKYSNDFNINNKNIIFIIKNIDKKINENSYSKLYFITETIKFNNYFDSKKFIWIDIKEIFRANFITYINNDEIDKNNKIYDTISDDKIDILNCNDNNINNAFILCGHKDIFINLNSIHIDNKSISKSFHYLDNELFYHYTMSFILKPLNNKYIVFKESCDEINNLKKYMLCAYLSEKYGYKFITYDDFNKLNENESCIEYIYFKGIDIIGYDKNFIRNKQIYELEYICKKNNYYAFNTLGFCKDIFDIYELKSNDYINESNNHGIYIKNIINITNDNINNYMDIFSKNENLNMHLFICDEKYDFEIKDNDFEITYINNEFYKEKITKLVKNYKPYKKVISYSLWGSNPTYTIGAIENAKQAKEYYSNFECWFYIHKDSVPENIIEELSKMSNVKIIFKSGDLTQIKPMMWRFEAIDDPCVELILSRDTDSRFLMKERLAVHEWINSDKVFHIMRDHPHHTFEILGGMFGTRKIHEVKSWIEKMKYFKQFSLKMYDQDFLAEIIYPIICNKDKSVIHASFHKLEEHSIDFPISYDDSYKFIGEYIYPDNSRSEYHIDELKKALHN